MGCGLERRCCHPLPSLKTWWVNLIGCPFFSVIAEVTEHSMSWMVLPSLAHCCLFFLCCEALFAHPKWVWFPTSAKWPAELFVALDTLGFSRDRICVCSSFVLT